MINFIIKYSTLQNSDEKFTIGWVERKREMGKRFRVVLGTFYTFENHTHQTKIMQTNMNAPHKRNHFI
jgi:type IV secretory pathway TrbF-like protein